MNYKARTELIGELLIMKAHDIKPNFSELSRLYGFDRSEEKWGCACTICISTKLKLHKDTKMSCTVA